MNKIIFYLCLISCSFSFSQYNDFLSYDTNRNSNKWTYFISKQEGNVFDGFNEEVIRHAKICNIYQDCLKLRQENDGEIDYRLDDGFFDTYMWELERFNLEKEKGFDEFNINTDTKLRLEIAFNNDPKTIEKFKDISPNINTGTLSMNKYFSDDDSKDIQATLNGKIVTIPPEELVRFIKAYPSAEILKPLSNFFNLLKSNSSIQIKMSGMGYQKVISFTLNGSSKALSTFN
jgi:hypothetical protein